MPVLCILLPAVLLACGPEPAGEAPAEPPPLTVMTYNLYLFNQKPDAAIAAIREVDADVVVLQEVSPGWAPYLRRHFVKAYPHIVFAPDRKVISVGMMSKLPLRKVTRIPSKTGGCLPAYRVHVLHPGGTVQLLGVHLRPPLWAPGGLTLTRLMRVGSEHLTDIRHFYGRLDPERPTLIAGDFNEADRGRAASWLVETRGMTNALAQFDPKSPTWHTDLRFYHAATRLDHILYSSHFECTSARVIPTRGSDHFPVVATFRLKRP